VEPSRRLIREAIIGYKNLEKIDSRGIQGLPIEKCTIILFNDLLVLASLKSGSQALVLINQLPLKSLFVKELPNGILLHNNLDSF
jgi:hypothetical protein